MMTEIPSCILSQYMWYNANIQVDKTPIQFSRSSEKILFHNFLITVAPIKNGWHNVKREYNLRENSYFQWVQLIDSIPEKSKFIIKKIMNFDLILSLMIII